MSTFAAVWDAGGRPCREADLQAMIDILPQRGPDGSACWAQGPAGLACRMLDTTGTYRERIPPITSPGGAIALSGDIRLDNRDELIKELELDAAGGLTDAELALAAYQRWDSECFDRLDGDWAMAIWDGRRKRMVLCRDRFGVRPVNYFYGGGLLVAASDPLQVTAHPAVARDIHWGVFGSWLCAAYTENEETLYAGVLRLPAGHYLVVDSSGKRLKRYWPSRPLRDIRYAREEEYAEDFRERLAKAVRTRLRSKSRVGIQVSGGLDSSSVACMADEVLRRESGAGADFETLSILFPGLDCDETEFSNAVAEKVGRTHHRLVHNPEMTAEWLVEKARQWPSMPFDPGNIASSELVGARAKDRGLQVVLGGMGGDELFVSTPEALTDRLCEPAWVEAHAEIRRLAHTYRTSQAGALWRYGVKPLVPQPLRAVFRRARRRLHPRRKLPEWVNPDFARVHGLAERLNRSRPNPSPVYFRRRAQQALFDCLDRSYNSVFALERRDYTLGSFGLQPRQPFYNRGLWEFVLTIPEDIRVSPKWSKHLLRMAMAGVLPEPVRTRKSKPIFDSLWDPVGNPAHRTATQAILSQRLLEREGIVHPGTTALLAAGGEHRERSAGQALNAILTMELWYAQIFRPSPKVRSSYAAA